MTKATTTATNKAIDWQNKETAKQLAAELANLGGSVTAAQLPALAEKFGVSQQRMRGKLVSMNTDEKKVYIKAEKATGSTGGNVQSKSETVKAITTSLSLTSGSLDTLVKANKGELETLWNALVSLNDKQDAESQA